MPHPHGCGIFCGESPRTISGLMNPARQKSSKTARPVASFRSAYGIRFVGRAALPPPTRLDDCSGKTEGPAENHHVIASRIAAHPRVDSLAPSGQFTFWQSPGMVYRFAQMRRRFPRPDGLGMTEAGAVRKKGTAHRPFPTKFNQMVSLLTIVTTLSTWAHRGNRSKACAFCRWKPFSFSRATSRARVAGSQET